VLVSVAGGGVTALGRRHGRSMGSAAANTAPGGGMGGALEFCIFTFFSSYIVERDF
jgi:hypothetical protein